MSHCNIFIASPVHDKNFINESIGKISLVFENEDKEKNQLLITDENSMEKLEDIDCDGFLAFVLTGGTEHLMLRIRRAVNEKPIIFLAHDKANSLPAVMEAAPVLNSLSKTSVGYIGNLNDSALFSRIKIYSDALNTVIRIGKARLGLFGGVSPWLVYSKVSKDDLKWKFGTELVDIPLERIYNIMDNLNEEVQIKLKPSKKMVADAEVTKAYKLYLSIKKVVSEEKLDGFTIKCFDIIKDKNTTACLALSLLNSEGVIAGCEGDVPAAIAMMIAKWVSDEPAFMANPAEINGNEILFAHCTAPLAMANNHDYQLKTHFETGKGVGVAVNFREGEKVTVIRLSPGLEKIRLIKGEVIKGSPYSNLHCRSQMRVKINNNATDLLENSMGNHHVIVYGDVIEKLKIVSRLLGMKIEAI